MTTLIEMFAEDRIWRRQLREVEKLRSEMSKVVNLARTIDDEIVCKQLHRVAYDIYQRLENAKLFLETSERRILATYNKLVTDYCDYSAHYDNEYFIEKIDLDGYLRGNIL